jgi:hypothetical protein
VCIFIITFSPARTHTNLLFPSVRGLFKAKF